jgi:hypothetical protein
VLLLPPRNTTCVTSAIPAPRTRTELPGRALVNDPQSVRHVTVDAVAGTDGAVPPPNAVPPVDADAGAPTALSAAMTMTIRRFSSIHSPG